MIYAIETNWFKIFRKFPKKVSSYESLIERFNILLICITAPTVNSQKKDDTGPVAKNIKKFDEMLKENTNTENGLYYHFVLDVLIKIYIKFSF